MIYELVICDVGEPVLTRDQLLNSMFDKDKMRQIRQTPRRGDILSVRVSGWGRNFQKQIREDRMIVRVRRFPKQMKRRLTSYLYNGDDIIHRRRFALDVDKLKPKRYQTIWRLSKYLIDKEQ